MRVFDEKICEGGRLTCYICEESPEMPNYVRDAMLVLPGGAYAMCSDREAEPIVKKYLAAGMNVFCLRYSCAEKAGGFMPLVEASYTMKYIREHAKEFNINENRVFAVGFSAGGHLCASLGTFWDEPWLREKLGPDFPRGINKPNGTVLAYPVISAVEGSHRPSMVNIIGKPEPTDEEFERFSVELHVGEQTAPCFIWSTSDDNAVPIVNSIRMADKLAAAGKQFELHIWPHGPHGLALAEEETSVGFPEMINDAVAEWIPLSIRWMRGLK
jgi:acetyl esterase/lipase